REVAFKEYLKTVGFNAEAVLLTYPNNQELTDIKKLVIQNRPEYEFTTTYRDTHYLWNVDDEELLKKIQDIFETIPSLYIAGRHYRSASSTPLVKDLTEESPPPTGEEPYTLVMSSLITESDLKIYEFNRLSKDSNGWTKQELLKKPDEYFSIEKRGMEY